MAPTVGWHDAPELPASSERASTWRPMRSSCSPYRYWFTHWAELVAGDPQRLAALSVCRGGPVVVTAHGTSLAVVSAQERLWGADGDPRCGARSVNAKPMALGAMRGRVEPLDILVWLRWPLVGFENGPKTA